MTGKVKVYYVPGELGLVNAVKLGLEIDFEVLMAEIDGKAPIS